MSNWPVMAGTCVVGAALGDDLTNSKGTSVTDTVGDGAISYGTWVEFSSSLPYTAVGVYIASTGGAAVAGYVEIGVGAAGSEQVVAELYLPANHYTVKIAGGIVVPVTLNKGQRIAVRHASGNVWTTTDVLSVTLLPILASWLYPAGYAKVALLAAAANNDSGGTANTMSAWSQVTASTAAAARAVIVAWRSYGDTGSSLVWELGVGAGGSEVVIASGVGANDGYYNCAGLCTIPAGIPASSRIAIRHQSSSNATSSTRNTIFAVHLCY
jgi:hypothetical protein